MELLSPELVWAFYMSQRLATAANFLHNYHGQLLRDGPNSMVLFVLEVSSSRRY